MTGQELQSLRATLGLTRQWVAVQAGITTAKLSELETHDEDVPQAVAARIGGIDNLLTAQAKHLYAVAMQESSKAAEGELLTLQDFDSDDQLWSSLPHLNGTPRSAYAAMLQIVREAIHQNTGAKTLLYYVD